ncbi:hypothetical protein K3495_g16127 [Podosphaera aphanis]|nr:hypothetical protein K3495_g16127 [Podosphaera aphanis]
MVMEEAALRTGITPISARALARDVDRMATDWIIHFPTGKPKLGDRLFEASGRLSEFHRQPRISQCNRCWGHHPTRTCSRGERCRKCGSLEHKSDKCPSIVMKCVNCHGPHAANELRCMARPSRLNGQIVQKTREQLQVIRRYGQRDRNAEIQKKEAEKLAEAATATTPPTTAPVCQ